MRYSQHLVSSVLGLALAFAGTPSVLAQESPNPIDLSKATPTATLDVEAKALRLIVGGERGSGVLHFQGQDFPFQVKGLSVGGVGFTEVDATGDVYFLHNVEDFPGTYSAGTAGVTVGKGMGGGVFQNDKGVVLRLKGKSKGVGLSLGLGGMEISLEQPAQ